MLFGQIKPSLGKLLCAYGQISIVINGPILKNVLAIWSHCLQDLNEGRFWLRQEFKQKF